MGVSKLRLLHESLRRYMRRQAWDHLDVLIGKTRDEELASVIAQMGEEQQNVIWERLPTNERRANVITLMDSPFGQNVLNPLEPAHALAVLQEMAPDDMADILGDLLPEKSAAILELLEESDEVEDLMRYGEETAGGIMIPEFFALRANDSAEEALAKLRDAGDVEMVYSCTRSTARPPRGCALSREARDLSANDGVGDIMETMSSA